MSSEDGVVPPQEGPFTVTDAVRQTAYFPDHSGDQPIPISQFRPDFQSRHHIVFGRPDYYHLSEADLNSVLNDLLNVVVRGPFYSYDGLTYQADKAETMDVSVKVKFVMDPLYVFWYRLTDRLAGYVRRYGGYNIDQSEFRALEALVVSLTATHCTDVDVGGVVISSNLPNFIFDAVPYVFVPASPAALATNLLDNSNRYALIHMLRRLFPNLPDHIELTHILKDAVEQLLDGYVLRSFSADSLRVGAAPLFPSYTEPLRNEGLDHLGAFVRAGSRATANRTGLKRASAVVVDRISILIAKLEGSCPGALDGVWPLSRLNQAFSTTYVT